MSANRTSTDNRCDIAVVGMAVRVPGANDLTTFWENLVTGRSAIRALGKDELASAGVPESLSSRTDYVSFAAPLDGFAEFDAEFFGLSPREAAVMDPQHRQFLEVAWEAMEHAGHPPETVGGKVGVYAGCGMGSYFYFNVCSNSDLVADTGMFLLRHTGNDKDFLPTRLSHVFDLKGPSLGVQTACSTSLVAIHQACRALVAGDCDLALAGGVTIELPQNQGYIYRKGEILSPDGTCRAFDHKAAGTVFGSGAGVVALRRLEDAIADGDHIWAVVKGSAVNNDGAQKASYLAPSVEGQADAIFRAHQAARVSADTIEYVECHGTGTYLGDPIEVLALTDAFRRTGNARASCRIGSVKTNIGHLDTAAGVASFAKAALSLHNEAIPPTLNFEKPNPAIDFDNSPFSVNASLTAWPGTGAPRRAGVNSLGVGGTNAHVVLEEAPKQAETDTSDWPFQPLVISARTKNALEAASDRLASYLESGADGSDLADVAFTLKEGRRAFDRRRVVVAESTDEAARLLRSGDVRRVFTHTCVGDSPDFVFMLPGGGAQYPRMACDLYETEPVFRDWMDRGLSILEPQLDFDIRSIWLPGPGELENASDQLQSPSVQLPLIAITEIALARLWMSWGVTPSALVGHSMGENVAACLAGVMSFEDCINLVLLRGRLFETVGAGGMLSAPLSEHEVAELIGPDLDIASVNANGLTVVSGAVDALEAFAARLADQGIEARRVQIAVAAHSRLLEPILGRFREFLQTIDMKAPEIPFVSNLTGDWIKPDEATDPEYWVRHLRETVRFRDALSKLAAKTDRIFIETGPGVALSSLAGQHENVSPNQVIGSLRHPDDDIADDKHFVAALARVWAAGGAIDWSQIWGGARRRRVPLPTYPFQHKRYFIERKDPQPQLTEEVWLTRIEDREKWAWRPYWKPTYAECDVEILETLGGGEPETWLIFEDDTGLGGDISNRLRSAGHLVTTVRPGDTFARIGEDAYRIAVEKGESAIESLLQDLKSRDRMPSRLVHLWLVTRDEGSRPGSSFFHRIQEQGFWSLFHFARAWGKGDGGDLQMTVVTSDALCVGNESLRHPSKATIAGPARVIPREFPGITCRTLDIEAPRKGGQRVSDHVLEEILADPANTVAAVRDGRRYLQAWRQTELPAPEAFSISPGSTILVTGALGGMGLALSEALVRNHGAKVAMLSRRELPERSDWDRIIARSISGDRLGETLKRLKALENAGGEVLRVQADVSNVEEVRRALDDIRSRLGPVSGVIHAAGTMNDAPLLSKDPIDIENVIAPKIYGTHVLTDLIGAEDLEWMALFSSVSTVTAPPGQVDYVAANEFLNAFALSKDSEKTRVRVIDWGPWAETGMAVDALSGMAGDGTARGHALSEPLLDVMLSKEDGVITFQSQWKPSDNWVLDQHRTRSGEALLPGTGYIELAAEALAASGKAGSFEIEDLTFLSPLSTPDNQVTSIQAELDTKNGFFVVQSGKESSQSNHAEARLKPLSGDETAKIDLNAVRSRTRKPANSQAEGPMPSLQSRHLALGRHWQVIDALHLGEQEVLADLHLPSDDGYRVHPAFLDTATGIGLHLIEGYSEDQFWVPLSYRRIRVFGPIPEESVSWVRTVGRARASDETATFDVSIAAPDGTVVIEVEGFTMHRMSGLLDLSRNPEVDLSQPDGRRANERLKHLVSQGIPTKDGVDFFFRALASNEPQVLISSVDLPAMISQVEAEAEGKAKVEQGFERPDLESDYVAPETEVQKQLAVFWSELLGIETVGIDDGFFDLGGHSLIAVRLFAKVKSAFSVDFPISILFEAPTIRSCAALIEERGGTAQSSDHKAPEEVEKSDFRYAVPMTPVREQAAPFFMVAGMFGNVLNLRHLAHLIGVDRPFYGLQARGLYGSVEPHDSLVDAARDYIEEIRRIQPEGPYMIGGFSGGGITAYEMAQQLQKVGQDVAALVLLDTPLPQRRPMSTRDRAMLQWLKFREEGLSYPVRWARRRIEWELEKRKGAAFETNEIEFHNTSIRAGFERAIASYEVKPWSGPVTLFRPPLSPRYEVAAGRYLDEDRNYVHPSNEWDRYIPDLDVIEVPGDHDSMVLEPNVRVLATHLRAVLNQAKKSKPSLDSRNLRAAE